MKTVLLWVKHLNRDATKISASLFLLLAINTMAFAENTWPQDSIIQQAQNEQDLNRTGFFLGLPAYLYSTHSVEGLQAGYQFKKVQIRFDAGFSSNHDNDAPFALQSFCLFWSHQLKSKIRSYEGITVGVESGLKDSFNGHVVFVNGIVGVELLTFDNTSFFIEIGSGDSFNPKQGAYNGGTIIGGGFKYFFGNSKRCSK